MRFDDRGAERSMTGGRVIVSAVVSVDGFIADADDGVGPLFEWYGNGDVEFFGNHGHGPFRTSAVSAQYTASSWQSLGAGVIGRHLFDLTDGWGGVPVVGDAVFVVSHRREPDEWRARFPDAPFVFVADLPGAIERAKAVAGNRDVSLNAGQLAGQALAAGLIDEVNMDVAPVIFGSGKRFFGDYAESPVLLENPSSVVQGDRVTHVRYRVRY